MTNTTATKQKKEAPIQTADSAILSLSKKFYFCLIVMLSICMFNIIVYHTGLMVWFIEWSELDMQLINAIWGMGCFTAIAACIIFLRQLAK